MSKIIIPKFTLDTGELPELDPKRWCLAHIFRGSVAHGMYRPSDNPNSIDDIDTIAICVPDIGYYLGLKEYGSRGTREIKRNEWDIVVYEAQKMISLLRAGNPNVLSVLWTDPKYWISISKAFELLVAHRDLFMTKQVYSAFAGYASQQLYKMEHQSYEGYMGEKRRALVDKHGYDTKNAAHCIRLLRMALTFFVFEFLPVERTWDREELLAIKDGALPLVEIKLYAESLFKEVKYACEKSNMPEYPDREAINVLCVNVVLEFYKERRDAGE